MTLNFIIEIELSNLRMRLLKSTKAKKRARQTSETALPEQSHQDAENQVTRKVSQEDRQA